MLIKPRSTHNTRIERLWVEAGTQFARPWRAFFIRLERLHNLDCNDPAHLWLLHRLFLDEIAEDCERFRQDWNSHPISGPDTNNCSPNVSLVLLSRPSISYLMLF